MCKIKSQSSSQTMIIEMGVCVSIEYGAYQTVVNSLARELRDQIVVSVILFRNAAKNRSMAKSRGAAFEINADRAEWKSKAYASATSSPQTAACDCSVAT